MARSFVRPAIALASLLSLVAHSEAGVPLEKRGPVYPAANLPGNWTSQGCYTDNVNGRRTLTGAVYTNSTSMTAALCIAFCDSKNWVFAGTEYANECYCGNGTATAATSVSLKDCNVGCSGNTTESCGGGSRLNLYWSNEDPPPGPQVNPGPGNWTSAGCYAEPTSGRALTYGAAVPGGGNALTVALCTSTCEKLKYVLAGVEYSQQCYCGNVFSNNAGPAPNGFEGCNMPCKGNSSEFCGGPSRLNVYRLNDPSSPPQSSTASTQKSTSVSTLSSSSVTPDPPATTASTTAAPPPPSTTAAPPPSTTAAVTSSAPTSTSINPPNGFKYAGCYLEGTNGRAIVGYQLPDNTSLTNDLCISVCQSKGYKVAGTEFGKQCFCGNSIANGAVLASADTQCNVNCAGNANQKCGGGSKLSVYSYGPLQVYQAPAPAKTNLPGSWEYVGCSTDNINKQRIFNWQLILADNNTAQNCLSQCSKFGYMGGGMQYGRECWCGDNEGIALAGATLVSESQCQSPCTGDPEQICGGGSRTTLYKWTGTPLYTFNKASGSAAGRYDFLIGGVCIPLITTPSVNGKVTFVEKAGTGGKNSTGAYELDLASIDDFSKAWRTMSVKTDVFCSASVTLPDKAGRQINIGGWSGTSTFGVRLYWPDGSPGQPSKNNWQENPTTLQLQKGRWYPSAMIMTNGSILVVGGQIGSNSDPQPSLELLPRTGPVLFQKWLNDTDPLNLYPFLCVLPSGGILVTYYNQARILDAKTFDTIKILPQIPGNVNDPKGGRTYPLEGTTMLMPQYAPYSDPLRVLICGGSTPGPGMAIDNCVSTQPDAPNPQWTIERMPTPRVIVCMCALPDGTYMIMNGAVHGVAGFGLGSQPNFQALMYDPSKPVNSRITIMVNATVARLYHSEAILLQDGRVLVSGSDPQDGKNPQERRVEVFLPPYLLNGQAKPTYTMQNKDWVYGQQIPISVSGGGNYRVSLMGAESSTHGNSMGQRTIFPSVSCGGGACTITAPPNANIAPPGWYQVFVLSGGTPSNSQFVRIGGDPGQLGNWPATGGFSLPGV